MAGHNAIAIILFAPGAAFKAAILAGCGSRLSGRRLDDKLAATDKPNALETSGIPVPEKRPER
jgi:hypothetical protein